MNAYQLETLLPEADGRGGKPNLVQRRLEVEREEAYHAGFLAGQSMATETYLKEQDRLTSDLIEAIGDARVTNEAARHHVVSSILPMVESIAAAIAPALADAGLAHEVARLVGRALALAPEAKPRLRCAPELVDTIACHLQKRGLAALIEEGPELLPREIQVFWDQGYDHVDLDACIAQIRSRIALHLRCNEGEDDDPRRYG
jgi:hypothetical protein